VSEQCNGLTGNNRCRATKNLIRFQVSLLRPTNPTVELPAIVTIALCPKHHAWNPPPKEMNNGE